MKKRVFLVHGWEGNPRNHWFPWLMKNLVEKGFEVKSLKMPNPDIPNIDSWVSKLKEEIPNPDKETYLIGHSIGCQTILRYIQNLQENTEIGGCVFVAGFFNLPNLENNQEKQIAKPWLEKNLNFEKIKIITSNFTSIFSDNDPDVPLKDSKIFKDELGSKIVIEHNKGHFTTTDKVFELPSVLQAILNMSES